MFYYVVLLRKILIIFILIVTGTLTVEEVYRDRDQFASLVREVAAPDVGRMGIEILSFTIKDVVDEVQYLTSLGKAQTANVKRDADTGVAEANRDAGIRVSTFPYYILIDNVQLQINANTLRFNSGSRMRKGSHGRQIFDRHQDRG